MATLTITDKKARELYPTASSDLKTILVETFGEKFFSQKITDRVKTWEDVYAIIGNDMPLISAGTKDEVAYVKLKAIAKVLNEGWVPDWNNSNQYKWYPWFYITKASSPSGFGLRDVYFDYSSSNVGSPLCFKSEELARYAATQFESIYKDYFTL